MRQQQDPEDFHHEDLDRYDDEEEDPEELGTPVYQGSGLSVRALTAEELQRFLDAHDGQPAEPLGSGWAALDPPGQFLGGPRTPPAATLPVVPAEVTGSLGSPGRFALAAYRQRRATELAAWARSLAWRAPLVAAALCHAQLPPRSAASRTVNPARNHPARDRAAAPVVARCSPPAVRSDLQVRVAAPAGPAPPPATRGRLQARPASA